MSTAWNYCISTGGRAFRCLVSGPAFRRPDPSHGALGDGYPLALRSWDGIFKLQQRCDPPTCIALPCDGDPEPGPENMLRPCNRCGKPLPFGPSYFYKSGGVLLGR
jgi:hypothetical protein